MRSSADGLVDRKPSVALHASRLGICWTTCSSYVDAEKPEQLGYPSAHAVIHGKLAVRSCSALFDVIVRLNNWRGLQASQLAGRVVQDGSSKTGRPRRIAHNGRQAEGKYHDRDDSVRIRQALLGSFVAGGSAGGIPDIASEIGTGGLRQKTLWLAGRPESLRGHML